jgi:ABC-type transporter Mla subunit MlaD
VSSDLVNADPNDVRKLARALQQYEEKVTELTKQTQRAIDQANWNDGQKERFAARYKDFNNQTNRFVSGQVRDFVKSLNALAADLERAKGHRF